MRRRILELAVPAAAAFSCAAVAVTPPPPEPPVHYRLPSVSSDRFESHPAFDPLTGDLYFVRSSPSFQGWRIWRAPCTPAGWGAAEPAAFGGPGVDADPFFTPDGRRLYFISSRPDPPAKTASDLDIWWVERDPGGGWGAPVRLSAPVNSGGQEWFPRLDRDGRLYFGSDRPGGHGQTDIYVARPAGDGWEVSNLGGEVSTAADDYEFEPPGDGRVAILMSDGALFRIDRAGEGWGSRTALLPGQEGFHVGPLLSPTGRTLLFARAVPDHSGELFRLSLYGPREEWPPACPPGGRAPPD